MKTYQINYFNNAYGKNGNFEFIGEEDDAIKTAKGVAALTEIKDVHLFEVKEIDFND